MTSAILPQIDSTHSGQSSLLMPIFVESNRQRLIWFEQQQQTVVNHLVGQGG